MTSLQCRLMKTGGRLVKHARYYWLLLAEGHLNRKLFGQMLGRLAALPVPGGVLPKSPLWSPERHDRAAFEGRSGGERSTERESSAKTVASQPWIADSIRAGMPKWKSWLKTAPESYLE